MVSELSEAVATLERGRILVNGVHDQHLDADFVGHLLLGESDRRQCLSHTAAAA